MRAESVQRASYGGSALIAAGGLLLALALALLIAGGARDQGAIAPDVPASPTAATSGVVAFWEQRVKNDPADFAAYNSLAQAYIQRARETGDVADYSRAETAVNASLRSLPVDNQAAHALQASLFAVRHQFEDALVASERAIALDPGDPFALGVRGDALLALGRYDEAHDSYRRLVAISPGLTSFSRLAYLLELTGDLGGSELAWKNALSTDGGRRPENTAWAHVQFGHFYFSRGNLDGAREQYERALRAFPGFVHALAGLGRVAAADGNYEEAILLYERAAARYPTPQYVSALGDVYHVAGNEDRARAQYDLVNAIDRLYEANGINTDLAMALFFADHDIRLDEAVRQSRAVYERRQSIQAADALAWALYKSGEYEGASRYAQEALRLGTPDATLLFHAGMIEYGFGNDDRAGAYLEQALDINPRFSVLYADEAVRTLDGLKAGADK